MTNGTTSILLFRERQGNLGNLLELRRSYLQQSWRFHCFMRGCRTWCGVMSQGTISLGCCSVMSFIGIFSRWKYSFPMGKCISCHLVRLKSSDVLWIVYFPKASNKIFKALNWSSLWHPFCLSVVCVLATCCQTGKRKVSNKKIQYILPWPK